jgi:hypothetical protein
MINIILYIYFAINLIIFGLSFKDTKDLKFVSILQSSIFIAFGIILFLYEFILTDKIKSWFYNSDLSFYYNLYFSNKYNNLTEYQINFIQNKFFTEKDKKLIKIGKLILKNKYITKEEKNNGIINKKYYITI